MNIIKKQTTTLGMICVVVAMTGCASQQEQAEQKAERQKAAEIRVDERQKAAQAKLEQQREASQRLANKQNWPKLREGLTVEEVDQLVGPIGAERKKMYKDSLKIGEVFSTLQSGPVKSDMDATFEMEAGVLVFHNGKLKSWQPR